MKFLSILLIAITILLTGCGGGGGSGIINPQPKKYPIESTSTSPNPGTLENYKAAKTYPTSDLKNFVQEKICLPGTTSDVCQSNISNLATDFNFNLDQISNGNPVTAYTVQYNTPGVKGENRSVSGGVLIPQVPENQIKGIVLYFHGTRIVKYDVPSCFINSEVSMDYCMGNSSDDGELLGGVLAAQGYIVVMPDYIGQGYDNVVLHPYVFYSKVNATSGLNMVTATRTLLSQLHMQSVIRNFYITGFSEGGAYALQASGIVQDPTNNFLQTNLLNLKDTVGQSGAYDLTNAQLPMETDNLVLGDKYNVGDIFAATSAKPVLTGFLLSSYGFYDMDQVYTTLMQKEFLDCRSCLISGKSYTIPDLFTIYEDPNFNNLNITLYITSAAAVTGYGVNGDNSAKALIQSGLLENSQFLASLASNSITNWSGGITPIGLTYLNKDSVVTNLNSTNMYSQLLNPNKTAIVIDTSKYRYVDTVSHDVKLFDHGQSGVIQLIAALQQFNRYQ
ncbi:MAG: hypothetical protein K0R14_2196 [Burkholderiales bacterium]|jgi:hypothetical protein|nr:hypothetical protein [Burkholderiales bacterium]